MQHKAFISTTLDRGCDDADAITAGCSPIIDDDVLRRHFITISDASALNCAYTHTIKAAMPVAPKHLFTGYRVTRTTRVSRKFVSRDLMMAAFCATLRPDIRARRQQPPTFISPYFAASGCKGQ